tara:strand:+ start:2755 stop:3414 length:660 start_codon:yes stop_codon:yes gene_type:complete
MKKTRKISNKNKSKKQILEIEERKGIREVGQQMTEEQRDLMKFVIDCTGRALRKHIAIIMRTSSDKNIYNSGADPSNFLAGLDKLSACFGSGKVKAINSPTLPVEGKALIEMTLAEIFGGNWKSLSNHRNVEGMRRLCSDVIANISKDCVEQEMIAGIPKAAKARRTPASTKDMTLPEKRARHAAAKRDEWERRLVAAEKKVKEYSKRVRYYERKGVSE